MNHQLTESDKEACRIVENLLRSVGSKACIQISSPRSVEVSDASWAGESSGRTLADAMEDALQKGQP